MRRQPLDELHAAALGDERQQRREVQLGRDNVLGADVERLEQARVQLADGAEQQRLVGRGSVRGRRQGEDVEMRPGWSTAGRVSASA